MKSTIIATISALAALGSAFGQAPWSGALMQRGIAAVTCGAPSEDSSGAPIPASSAYTFGLFDLRNPAPADYGPCQNVFPPTPITTPIWNAPQYHHPTWNVKDLGDVFGIALDGTGDMYVGAHGLYGTYRPLHHRYGDIGGGANSLAAAGTVYRINKTTGVVSVFCVIPGQQAMTLGVPTFVSGPGLGNVTYDRDHNQFFVTSLEDGKIYRVSSAGAILNSFDPMGADNGAVGMPPRNERLWAVEYENNRVYYSVWNDGTVGNPSVIRKVDLLPSGDFDPSTDALLLTVPGQAYASSFSPSPVSDITFTLDGQTMVLGVRTMTTDVTAYNHASGTHVVQLVSGVWTHQKFQRTGCNVPDGESYGGVALGQEGGVQDSVLWSSSADMVANYGPHGLFGVRMPDVPVNAQAVNSWKVPYIPGFSNVYQDDRKGSGGDVEVFRERDDCATVEVRKINCPEVAGGPYTLEFTLTHNVPGTNVAYLQYRPCPAASLPTGAITVQPAPTGIQTLTPQLPPGTPRTFTVTLPGVPLSGGTVCFNIKLFSETGAQCCLEKVCVELPSCDCAELVDTRIDCKADPATGLNKYTLTLTVKNQTNLSATPFSIAGATFLPPAGFDQSSIVISPASIAPGATGTITVCYYGVPGPLCFNLALHDGTEELCCAIEKICLDLPPCDGGGDPHPDTCGLERKVPCCPKTGKAVVHFTVCNNSLSPRTYSWSVLSTPTAGCPIALDASDFSPSSGVLGPIPPNGCLTVAVTIDCKKLVGDRPCANYEFCATVDPAVPPLCCSGVVYRPDPSEVVVKTADPAGGGGTVGATAVRVEPGSRSALRLLLENPTSTRLDTSISFFDELGVLAILDGAGTPLGGRPIPISLAPNESQVLTVNLARRDNGDVDGWSAVSVLSRSGAELLVVPVLLQGPSDGALPIMAEISTVEEPEVAVRISIQTMPGRLYQIQESSDLQGAWVNTPCTVAGGETLAGGMFLGTGGIVTCYVPCESSGPRMFYRTVRLD